VYIWREGPRALVAGKRAIKALARGFLPAAVIAVWSNPKYQSASLNCSENAAKVRGGEQCFQQEGASQPVLNKR
jgi:hypothetical protein